MAKIDATWKDVDDLIKLRRKKDKVIVSVKQLEKAFATEDEVAISSILTALRGSTDEYEADVYPLSGVRLTIDIQKNRFRRYFEEDSLLSNIYSQTQAKMKEAEEKDSAVAAAEKAKKVIEKAKKATSVSVGPDAKVEEIGVIAPPAPKSPKIAAPLMTLREQIKFNHLKPNEKLQPYVPSIDDNYVFPAWTEEFVSMVDNGLNVWLYGGTGAGKSSLAEQICNAGNLPLMYQSFHEDIKPDQLFGGKDLVDGNTVWVDGPVTKAYREGFVLLLDEIDGLPPEIQFCLYGILDRKPLVLAENGNEIVKPHPNFRAIATGNTQGRGDEVGIFAGTNVLNRAFLNRYRVWYKVEYPDEKTYKAIIEKEGVTASVARVIAKLAQQINSAFLSGILTETFSLRDAREVAKVAELADGNVGRALQLTLLNRLSSLESAAVSEMFRKIIPSDM